MINNTTQSLSICNGLLTQYNIVPGTSWGTVPTNIQSQWIANNCEVLINGNATLDTLKTNCNALKTQYNITSSSNVGSANTDIQNEWKYNYCDYVLNL